MHHGLYACLSVWGGERDGDSGDGHRLVLGDDGGYLYVYGAELMRWLTLLLLLSWPVSARAERILAEQRTYNQEVTDLGQGQKRYDIHAGHIHYKDDQGTFQLIDTTLVADASGWHQAKSSWHGAFPTFADEEFEFTNVFEGKSHTIRSRPVATHVAGELVNVGPLANKQVRYTDAFGNGKHLVVTARNHGMLKEVVIDEKPDPLTDLSFDFEVIPDADSRRIFSRKEGVLTISSQAHEVTGDDLTFGTDQLSYSREALMWDATGATQLVKLELVRLGATLVIRKTIPAEFLQRATYPVTTDHPTDYYVGAGDGFVQSGVFVTWDTAHDATDGASVNFTSAALLSPRASDFGGGTQYIMNRLFLPIDTSGIADTDTITAATLNIFVNSIGNGDNDGDDFIVVLQASQASPTELVNADYDQCGSVDSPTEGSDRLDISSLTTSAYNSWTLNATGLGWISKTGTTLLCQREGHDVLDSPTAASAASHQGTACSETSGTGSDPYLSVTSSTATTSPNVLYGATIYGATIQ